MVIIKIITNQDECNSIDVSSKEPSEVLKPLLSTNSEWEIDYSAATSNEKSKWHHADLYNRCIRALSYRNLPLSFLGKTFNNFEEFKEELDWFLTIEISPIDKPHKITFRSGTDRLTLLGDDESGVKIERNDLEQQREIHEHRLKVYKESLKAKTDFRKNGLGEEYFRSFFQRDLLERIDQKANHEINELLDYVDQYRLKLKPSFYAEALSLVLKQGTDRQLIFHIRELVRVSAD
jgi:hypothetical protein